MFIQQYTAFVVLLVVCRFSETEQSGCKKNEISMTYLDHMKETVFKMKDLFMDCNDTLYPVGTFNGCFCGKKDKFDAYYEVIRKLIKTSKEIHETNGQAQSLPADCLELQQNGQNTSGVYTIHTKHPLSRNECFDVYCDMDTDGGGWTVIQRRFTEGEDFYKSWQEYKLGFGDLNKDFWLGNEKIYLLTNQAHNTLRFDLEDIEEVRKYAFYNEFRLENENDDYRLRVSEYKGDAGDSMTRQNGERFTTKDRVNDRWRAGPESCADLMRSGWWSGECSDCNPNGDPGQSGTFRSLFWRMWKTYDAMKSFEMKIRRNGEFHY